MIWCSAREVYPCVLSAKLILQFLLETWQKNRLDCSVFFVPMRLNPFLVSRRRTYQRFTPRLKGVGLIPRMGSVRIFVFPIRLNLWRPQRDSNPCCSLERAVS